MEAHSADAGVNNLMSNKLPAIPDNNSVLINEVPRVPKCPSA